MFICLHVLCSVLLSRSTLFQAHPTIASDAVVAATVAAEHSTELLSAHEFVLYFEIFWIRYVQVTRMQRLNTEVRKSKNDGKHTATTPASDAAIAAAAAAGHSTEAKTEARTQKEELAQLEAQARQARKKVRG